jgi:hypothetical protein
LGASSLSASPAAWSLIFCCSSVSPKFIEPPVGRDPPPEV